MKEESVYSGQKSKRLPQQNFSRNIPGAGGGGGGYSL